ncbi:cyclic GMP-binding protein C-like [Orbicella faveolata]|uniref:cyclic GMP-binding protein C-like n=1 Tax=Orbicella faveolata TaxID=48498 RepID=UPI0009E26F4E|nr:cyclic GMP-binding protein C-like [Orbicella faveolata]
MEFFQRRLAIQLTKHPRGAGTFFVPKRVEEDKKAAGTTTVVPPEILARGPLALEAYNKALAEGRTCDKRVPIMLIGQDRSGKTSLKNSLRGKPFNSDEDSTVGIKVDPSHFKVSTEIWKAGEKNQETNSETSISYEHHVARLTVEHLRQKEGISKECDPERKQDYSSEVLNIERSEASARRDTKDSISFFSASDAPDTTTREPDKLSGVSKDSQSSDTSHVQIFSDPEPSGDSITGIPDDIATLIEVLLREVDKVDDEEDIYSVLWDFGGQSVYYATHPLFLTSKAIYLLVNDLSRNPHERAKSVMKQGMFTKFEDSFDFRTNLDYLEFWMSSVASLASEDECAQKCPRSELLLEKLPPVFLVCTHADKPYDCGDPSTLANMVFGSLQRRPYKTHLYGDVFVVDNTKSGNEPECSEVVRLRKEVLDVAKELPQIKEAIPIKWLRYEKALQVMKEAGHQWIPLDTAKHIATEVCNVVDDKQFHTLLKFFHDKRILIHFEDTPELNRLVVLDHQWLIDVLKTVITIRPFHGKEKKFIELWCKLEKEGILDEKLLEHVWGPLFDSKETPESLIAIMEKFSLLCPLPSSDESCSKQYLVPSVLMSHPPDGIVELIKSAQIPSLFLKFESDHVPPGLFPRLVLQVFQWAKDECMRPVDPQLYHNFARFYTSEEENYSVVLLCHSFSIEVVVHKGNSSHGLVDNLSADASYDTCPRAVRRQLGLILESMRKEFCWLKNMKYEVSFICPVCCQGSVATFCRTHRTKGCEQEECLHFWSESQLCDGKIIFCSKSAVAQNNRIETEQFAPWLPLTNQIAAEVHDGRNLVSAEVTKEIALPGEVQDSLLSQSCGAKEIVLKLKENMQLEQASLEEPDSETKALIRCLARKSKDSNRLDVFQHLREITPAGTTGPLLPEQLDVRNIPVSKGREVTINLSGKCYVFV